jgi:hypothetical protein
MGYYPTPLPVVERVRTFIDFPEYRANILDPCCGDPGAYLSKRKRRRRKKENSDVSQLSLF